MIQTTRPTPRASLAALADHRCKLAISSDAAISKAMVAVSDWRGATMSRGSRGGINNVCAIT